MKNTTLMLLMLSLLSIIPVLLSVPYKWFLTVFFSSVLYGALSPLISARRIYFLAAEAPHTSLLSITAGIILSNTFPILDEFYWAILLSTFLLYLIGFAIRLGFDPDIVTSAAIALTASASVIAVAYVLSKYSIKYNLWSVILGDPLLTTAEDLYILACISLIVLCITLYIFRINVYIGVDTDYMKLHGVRLNLYDAILFAIIGVASVALLKIVGFVLEHVLLLLPSIIAMNFVEGSNQVFATSILLAVIMSMVGLIVSIHLNIAPAGSIGLTAFLFYATTYCVTVKKGG
ncbi:MAG: metal ABC transporter permease [Ignisphaera sp.]|nr:metal ABC transporter permease [Ignisphaera sp.]MCX8167496.1 metal ABC transporter permease [Ignisphaera sp.]MDW8084640.1 metal ABC transporter permease [Ignisphaera sp.]